MARRVVALLGAVALAPSLGVAQQLPEGSRFELRVIEPVGSVRARFAQLVEGLEREGASAACLTFPGEARCLRSPEGTYLLRPPWPVRREGSVGAALPTPVPGRLRERGDGFDARFGWAPAELAAGGRDSVARWVELMATGRPERCTEEWCEFMINGVAGPWTGIRTARGVRRPTGEPAPEPEAIGDVIAACRFERLGDAFGPPSACRQVAVWASDTAWVTVLVGFDRHERPPPPPPPGPGPHGDAMFVVSGMLPDRDLLVREIGKALEGTPLALETRVRSGRVKGFASYRVSPVLPQPPPYRELVEVTVHADRWSRGLEILADIALNVNPQNTTRPEDWHLANPAQLALYERAVRARVRGVLGQLCPRGGWVDGRTIECRR